MKKVIIMGAAGRDFHNFNTFFRDNPDYQVVAFTATQIPDIDGRNIPRPRRQALSQGHPDPPRGGARRAHRRAQGRRRRLRLQRRPPRVRHAQGLPGPGRRRQLRPPRPVRHDDQEPQARHLRLRRPDRLRQEPDHPPGRRDPQGQGPPRRRHPPPHALRRPGQAEGPALRHLRRPRQARVHDRGARGVRAPHRQRHHRLRRRRLRGHPPPGREGSRRHPLGRRQQRLPLLQVRPRDRRRRPPPGRARALLLPRRDQLPPGRRHRHQQDRHGHPGRHRHRPGQRQGGQPQGHDHPGHLPDHRRGRRAGSAASASWSSRTARPSPTAG